MMDLKENVSEAQDRMAAWWDHEIIDRPVLAYSYRKMNFKPSAKYDQWDLAQNIDGFSENQSKFEKYTQNQYFGGEQFPRLWPNYGPGIAASVFGIEPVFKNGTVWFDQPTPITEIENILESTKLDANNEWYSRLLQVTKSAVDHSNGRYNVAVSDIGGVLDILSSYLGPKEIIIAMRRKPDLIDTCRSIILEKLLKIYDDIQSIIDDGNLGCNSWLDVWCPKHWYPMQCDFSAMLSPKWFRRFVLPDLIAQAEHMDYAIYHLDGPNQLKYIDDLIAEPSITGIQWVPGIGEASMEAEKWFPLYKKIQKVGKNLVIDSSPIGVDHLYKNLDPRGLYVKAHMGSRTLAKIFLPKFMNGWGAPFRKSFTKLSEDYMVVNSKFRLKVMNKMT